MSFSAPLPTVSIVIPTYEASRALVDAIDSVLEQKGLIKDIIVIEDGSSKPSVTLLEDNFAYLLNNPEKNSNNRIRYIFQENTGAYHARLNCVPKCTGEFIKFLDQDDVLLPDTLQEEVAAFTDDVDVVLTNWQIETVQADAVSRNIRHVKAPVYFDPIDDFLTVGGCYTSAVLYRRSTTMDALKPINQLTPVKADDWLIFAQVCLSGARYKTIDIESYRWIIHGDNLSEKKIDQIVLESYLILDWIQSSLEKTHRLNEPRKKLLANYYAKQLLMSLKSDRRYFLKIADKIAKLDKNYRMTHGNFFYRFLCDLLGMNSGARCYYFIRRLIQ